MFRAGRPREVDNDIIDKILLQHKSELVLPGNKVLSKKNILWRQIAQELDNIKSEASLYTYVSNNLNHIRDKLAGIENEVVARPNRVSDVTASDESSLSSIFNDSGDTFDTTNVTIVMKFDTFSKMVVRKRYKNRHVMRLESGVWQQEISERLWKQTKLKCGFNFKNHHLSNDLSWGSAKGACKCKSGLEIKFEKSADNMILHCSITIRKGACGKRQLREPYRSKVVELLAHKSAERVRIEVASATMSPGDPEPPTLPKSGTLNNAKYAKNHAGNFNKDAIVAIATMKRKGRTQDRLTIRDIGYDPFFVHYWSDHQSLMYKRYAKREVACLKIDASDGFVAKLKRSDGSLSSPIFLYIATISTAAGQFAIAQMLSESQNTVAIQNWLTQLFRSGMPPPKETVADSCRALQTAIVRSVCGYITIEKYCDQFLSSKLPNCYVRIDVAHFIKIYSRALEGGRVARLIKKFYMAVIGQIILCKDLETAKTLIKKSLIVSMSETEGTLGDKTETSCNAAKKYLIDTITGNSPIDDVLKKLEDDLTRDRDSEKLESEQGGMMEDEGAELGEEQGANGWSDWADDVMEEVKAELANGDLPNAHHCEVFTKHLMADIKHLPMWSCVFQKDFGYGRIPASSATVESEINKLKNIEFDMKLGKTRVDRFLSEHISIIHGKMLLADAKENEQLVNNSNNSNEIMTAEPPIKKLKLDCVIEKSINENVDNEIASSISIDTFEKEREDRDEYNNINAETMCSITCPACANGDEPTGAHTCAACDRAVHVLPECSVALPDTSEGYGEQRLCTICDQSDAQAAKNIIATRYIENWKGLGKTATARKRMSKYLGNDSHMSNIMNFPKNKSVPIIKNGSCANGITKIQQQLIGVTNTCAFDAILQVVMLSLAENDHLQINFEDTPNNFIQLALHIVKNGLKGRHAYAERTAILYEYLQHEDIRLRIMGDFTLLDCAIGITTAVLHIFREYPSCVEVSQCANNCLKTVKKRTSVLISHSSFNYKNFDDAVAEHLKLPSRPCGSCNALVHTEITKTGKLMFFEVQDADIRQEIRLEAIPCNYSYCLNGNDIVSYKLVGVINFQPPFNIKTRNSKTTVITPNSGIGHYTALCPRRGNDWMEMDDLSTAIVYKKKSSLCRPALLIYSIEN